MMRIVTRFLGIWAGVLMLAGASDANATIVFSDNFDGEAAGQNYSGFANWTVELGAVDVVEHDVSGTDCFGGGGKCVDLDGSMNDAGRIVTKDAFAFGAGDVVTITFQVSGNQQRGAAADALNAGFNFDGPKSFTVIGGGPFAFADGNQLLGITGYGAASSVQPDQPFTLYTLGFVADSAGTVRLFFTTAPGDDNVGPVLDNVVLDISAAAVPEPSTWAVMLLGFGGLGAALRRRRASALAA